MKNSKKVLLASLLVSSFNFTSAMAQENVLTSDPININGYVTDEEDAVDAELQNVENELQKQKKTIVINKKKQKKYNELSRSTEKLADVTEDMIVERKESQETIDRYNKKIDCLMAESFKEGCEEFVRQPIAKKEAPKQDVVQVQQAAPAQTQAVVSAPVDKDEFGGTIKILPYTGISSINSDNEDLSAGSVFGINLETNINPRFAMGLGFNYLGLTTNDYDRQSGVRYFREMKYSKMNFDAYGKFYLLKNDRFRPYVGAGVGYSRGTLEYTSDDYYYDDFTNDDEVTSTGFNIKMMAGSEIKFTENIGANVEFSYVKGLSSNTSSRNTNNDYYWYSYSDDDDRLEDLADELAEANIMSIFAGLLVEF